MTNTAQPAFDNPEEQSELRALREAREDCKKKRQDYDGLYPDAMSPIKEDLLVNIVVDLYAGRKNEINDKAKAALEGVSALDVATTLMTAVQYDLALQRYNELVEAGKKSTYQSVQDEAYLDIDERIANLKTTGNFFKSGISRVLRQLEAGPLDNRTDGAIVYGSYVMDLLQTYGLVKGGGLRNENGGVVLSELALGIIKREAMLAQRSVPARGIAAEL